MVTGKKVTELNVETTRLIFPERNKDRLLLLVLL